MGMMPEEYMIEGLLEGLGRARFAGAKSNYVVMLLYSLLPQSYISPSPSDISGHSDSNKTTSSFRYYSKTRNVDG